MSMDKKQKYRSASFYMKGMGSLSTGNYHRAAMFFMEGMNKSPLYEERNECRNKFLAAVAMDAELPY